jgi:UDP-N-acetylmuramoylalanine--D-glutamate ligase
VGEPAPWLVVTGTNGKTTTVQLATAMLIADGKRAIACGNVGVPVLDAIRDPVGWDALVVELSSFQLHYTDSMSAHSSVCLNVAADHLDWHGSEEAYSAAKAKVYNATQVAAVYNRADPATLSMVEEADVVDGCRAIGFDLGIPGLSDFGVVEGILCDRAFGEDRHSTALELATVDELRLVGLGSPHMVSNVLAAAALVRSIGTSVVAVHDALLSFHLDHHRTEVIRTRNGIRWINDSKATNPPRWLPWPPSTRSSGSSGDC